MLDFNEIEFELDWEDGRAVILAAWHLVENRDLTTQEIAWFEENFAHFASPQKSWPCRTSCAGARF